MMCLAKSMAGGIPMGAVLIAEPVGEMPPAAHGSTFGGNPLACAAGLAVLDVLEQTDLVARARELGEQVKARLAANLAEKAVREVRGRGLMIGIELRGKVAPILKSLQAQGVVALPAGPTVLRLLPPLVIREDSLWHAVGLIEEVVNDAF
jgi:acetylornithine/LysW-gamma-L-lysine aminotransferase